MNRALRLSLLAAAALVALLVAACSVPQASAPAAPPAAQPVELTVFAAASLTDAFRAIAREFEAANPGVTVMYNFAGSQQLAQQLAQGAPADVFASANEAQMRAAVDAGRVAADSVALFARNELVAVAADGTSGVSRLEDLAAPGVKVVLAAGDVPAGRYALAFLDKAAADPAFGAGYRARVEANVVSYEQNVRAVLAKVSLGEADAGIVYVTDVVAAPDSPVRRIEIPDALNVAADYPIAPVSDAQHPDAARRFVEFVGGDGARAILEQHGFRLP